MKYRFSFTGASAMIAEFSTLAAKVYEGAEIEDIDDKTLGREKLETNRREFRELKHRINTLTPKQIEILSQGDLDEKKHITHLALCKTYKIYHDFLVDVIHQKMQVFDNHLTELDYNSFISKKKMDHPELEKLAETTQKKVKQVMFRMLEQVGIIESVSNSIILMQHLSAQVETAIIEDDSTWLSCFMYDEQQIKTKK